MPEYTTDDLRDAAAPIASLISKSEKACGKLAPGSWQHTMLQDNLKALRLASALMEQGPSDAPVRTREDLHQALAALASMIGRTEDALGKFAPGKPQHSLQRNRLKALRVAEALVREELDGGCGLTAQDARRRNSREGHVTYVALLRGINVGSSVRVPMKELKALLERLGLTHVVTYLNSGNAVFRSALGAPELTALIEGELERAFGQRVPTLVKTAAEMIAIADAIPAEWKNDATQQTYVAYLFSDVDSPALIDELPVKRQYMSIFHTPGAIVWNIKREDYNRSQITRIVGHHAYARMTTRNVNTARKLAALCSQD